MPTFLEQGLLRPNSSQADTTCDQTLIISILEDDSSLSGCMCVWIFSDWSATISSRKKSPTQEITQPHHSLKNPLQSPNHNLTTIKQNTTHNNNNKSQKTTKQNMTKFNGGIQAWDSNQGKTPTIESEPRPDSNWSNSTLSKGCFSLNSPSAKTCKVPSWGHK